jgi:hypothetical protein
MLGACDKASNSNALVSDKQQKNLPTNRPIEITVANLVKAYEENIVAADYKYTDKLLSVTGDVIRIQRYPDVIQVHLSPDSRGYPYVACVFGNDRFEDVLPLKVGEQATIKGAGRGKKAGWGEKIVIEDCFVSPTAAPQPTTGSTLPPYSSPTKAFSSSSLGATARCRDGTLSYSQHRRGTCSHHGGVAEWF